MRLSHIRPGRQHVSAARSGLRLQQVGLACCQVNSRQLHFNVLAPAAAAVSLLAQEELCDQISVVTEKQSPRGRRKTPLVNHRGHQDGWNAFSPTAYNNKCTEIDAAFVL